MNCVFEKKNWIETNYIFQVEMADL
jgi:hypothetical protein